MHKKEKEAPGCPFNKFRPCRGAGCVLYTQLRGTHPQTGQELDEHGCALAWGPVLLVEAAKETRQAAAATESLRNTMLVQGQAGRAVLLHAARIAGGQTAALDGADREETQ